MSSSRVLVRHVRSLPIANACAFCHARQFTPCFQGITANRFMKMPSQQATVPANGPRHSYATSTRQKLDVKRLRTDVDERARIGFYTLTRKQGVMHIDPAKANSIAKEFLKNEKNMKSVENIKRLSTKYSVSVEDLASLALVTLQIPDLKNAEKKATLPPSCHKPLAIAMLEGCAELEDPLTITYLMTAIYFGQASDDPKIKARVSKVPPSLLPKYHEILSRLAANSAKIALGPDVLTLQGLFLESEGKIDEAEAVYTQAVQRTGFKFNPKARHPMSMPLITPWNALGQLLKSSQDPSKQEKAKEYFRRGAIEGDDPVSCLELAAMEKRGSLEWLKYTSKVAASGHRDSIVELAAFYEEASKPKSALLAANSTRKALDWLLGWKSNSVAKLAREWQRAAALMGHKPSLLKLADERRSMGDAEGEKTYLRALTEPPTRPGQIEEWPQLAQLGRQRLAGIR